MVNYTIENEGFHQIKWEILSLALVPIHILLRQYFVFAVTASSTLKLKEKNIGKINVQIRRAPFLSFIRLSYSFLFFLTVHPKAERFRLQSHSREVQSDGKFASASFQIEHTNKN